MAQTYNPANTYHPTIVVPDDGDKATAGSINTQGLKYLSDNNAYLKFWVDRKIDGVSGNLYNPNSVIVIRGDGMDIDPLIVTDGSGGVNVADAISEARRFTDICAANWPEYGISDTGEFVATPANGQTFLVAMGGSNWAVKSSANYWFKTGDGGRTFTAMGQPTIDTITGMYQPYWWGDDGNANGSLVCISSASATPKKSTNRGTSWSDGGTTTTGLITVGYRPENSRWIAAGINKIRTDENLTGTWTSRSMPAGWATKTPIQIVNGPNEVLIIPRFIGVSETPSTVLRSSTGSSWAESSTIPVSGTNWTLAGAAWSDIQELWMLSSYQGAVWTSPDGVTWSGPFSDGPGGRIAVIGRVFVVAGSSIAYTTSGSGSWKYVNDFASDGAWNDVIACDSRLIVGAHIDPSGAADDELEFRFSLRDPLVIPGV